MNPPTAGPKRKQRKVHFLCSLQIQPQLTCQNFEIPPRDSGLNVGLQPMDAQLGLAGDQSQSPPALSMQVLTTQATAHHPIQHHFSYRSDHQWGLPPQQSRSGEFTPNNRLMASSPPSKCLSASSSPINRLLASSSQSNHLLASLTPASSSPSKRLLANPSLMASGSPQRRNCCRVRPHRLQERKRSSRSPVPHFLRHPKLENDSRVSGCWILQL